MKFLTCYHLHLLFLVTILCPICDGLWLSDPKLALQQQQFNNRFLNSKKEHKTSYIVGGVPVLPGEASYQVSLQRKAGHFCGGTIIDDYWILTAGHCVMFKNFTKNPLKIRYNTLHHKSGGSFANISEIIGHKEYDSWDYLNDIALIRTKEPMVGVQKAVLPPLESAGPQEGTDVLIVGWGYQHENGTLVPDLLKTTISVVSRESCNSTFKKLDAVKVICAGIEDGTRDGCQGDSGGPALIGNIVVGVVSVGIGCGRPNTPGAYTRVSSYRQWIHDHTGL